MPRGLAESFVRITQHEERKSVWSLAWLLPVGWLGYFLAELSDVASFGWNVRFYLGALLVGFVVGLFVAHRVLDGITRGLRTMWTRYMRFATAAAGLLDVDRLAHGKGPSHLVLQALFVSTVFSANTSLFTLLWMGHDAGAILAPYLLVLDGALLGGYAAWRWLAFRWAHAFIETADELAGDGAVAVWGDY
ncbi:MAG: hypothetical protein ACT4PT_10745 [Methanobacteriota archaeon]